MIRLLPALLLMVGLAACSKSGDSSSSIVGKWKQTAFYDGRITGCQCWATVDSDNNNKYEFKADGGYVGMPPIYSSLAVCTGNWRIVNDSTLALTNCGLSTETMHLFKKEGNTLTIDFDIPNYPYKMKFVKVRTF